MIYGLGDKTGYMNKRGYEYDNWNTDDPAPHLENFTRLYKSVPVMFGLKDGHPYGLFFDNPYRSHFDLGKKAPITTSIQQKPAIWTTTLSVGKPSRTLSATTPT